MMRLRQASGPTLAKVWTYASMAAALLCAHAAFAQPTLDQPVGGWRQSAAEQRDFLQEAHYPASSVNIDGNSAAALIRGRLSTSPKQGPTARLIVDGIALPLSVKQDGSFARPWSFARGSHGVELRAPDGAVRRRQFYETRAGRVPSRLRVVLSWDSDGTDLDLHVISPDGQHVSYVDRVASNGGALDVDVTTGFGPEIFATPNPLPGLYHVFVNYYGAGERRDVITTAQVAIIEAEGTLREKQEVFRIPMRKPGELTLVRSFLVP